MRQRDSRAARKQGRWSKWQDGHARLGNLACFTLIALLALAGVLSQAGSASAAPPPEYHWGSYGSPVAEGMIGVCAVNPDEAWAVGFHGKILHYFEGSGWTEYASPTTRQLEGVTAASPSDVRACGYSGTIIHFDGSEWKQIASPTDDNLHAIYAVDYCHIRAVGDNSDILFISYESIYKPEVIRREVLADSDPGAARILDANATGASIGAPWYDSVIKYDLEVFPEKGEPYKASTRIIQSSLPSPLIVSGATVPVAISRKNKKLVTFAEPGTAGAAVGDSGHVSGF